MPDTSPPETDPRDLKIAEQARLLVELTKENQQLREQNKKPEERIKRLEAMLATKVDAKSSKKPVFTENYSLDRNKLGNQDSDNKPPKRSTGRKPCEAKEHLDSDTIEVFPPDIDRGQCVQGAPKGGRQKGTGVICVANGYKRRTGVV